MLLEYKKNEMYVVNKLKIVLKREHGKRCVSAHDITTLARGYLT